MSLFLKKLFDRISRKDSITIAREKGVRIGEDCRVLADPYHCFGSEPYLVEIGNHVEITNGCRFITHDGGVWVIRNRENCEKIDKFGKITVGNNVFIGVNTIILPGVIIGDNCIIGAGAVVTKSIPANQVWAGVPARYIKTLDSYAEEVLRVADYTKGLSSTEKKKAIVDSHPDWFK